MELDPKVCYEAVRARDRRFDGRFFTGVLTTGIYCRPVCPARTPLAENVRFFSCAAAAEDAGFRPCKRCRPETSPGTPAWLGSSAIVDRALRMIDDGALDGGTLDDLAARFGLGGRHLRRLFAQHLGAAPASIARSRRVHFGRRLLDETDLPVTQVAFAAGFGSVRQFNDAFRATFRSTPTDIRRRPHRDHRGLTVRLPYRAPFDWDGMIAFMAPRALRGVELVEAHRYVRVIDAGRTIEVRPGPDTRSLTMRVDPGGGERLIALVQRARRLFDLDADPDAIDAMLATDAVLEPLVRARPGMRVPGAWDPFELAVRAIIGQQISVRGATTLANRIVEAFGKPVEGIDEPTLTHLFPSPETLADADLAGVGLTGAQADAIRGVARAVVGGEVALEAPMGLEDLVARLTALRGVGPWTAHYIAMRACGEPDAFPVGDLGVRRALGLRSDRDLLERADAWRPWRAYATMHVWMAGIKGES